MFLWPDKHLKKMATESGVNLISQIQSFNTKSLKNVSTKVTTVGGRKFLAEHDPNNGESVLKELDDEPTALGYCPDYSTDMIVGIAMERVLVSSQDVAHDLEKLKELKVTHILNVAYGVTNIFPEIFTYLTEEMYDDEQERLLGHYGKCETFIDTAMETQGTVLVHCNAGRSRSASIALAYVMHKKKWSLQKALEHLQKTRPTAQPNKNFMEQLKEIETNII